MYRMPLFNPLPTLGFAFDLLSMPVSAIRLHIAHWAEDAFGDVIRSMMSSITIGMNFIFFIAD